MADEAVLAATAVSIPHLDGFLDCDLDAAHLALHQMEVRPE